MPQTSWPFRPVQLVLLLACLLLANVSRAFADPNNTEALNFSETDIICPGKTFCTEVPNYLERTQLHKVSGEKFAQFKMYFRDDYTDLSAVSLSHYTQLEEEDYCDSQTQLEYPKSAQTKDSKWVLVVQYGDNKQGISMEQCVGANRSCRFEDGLPLRFTSRCKQSYTFRTLVVVMNGELREELVKVPTYCKCVIKHNDKI